MNKSEVVEIIQAWDSRSNAEFIKYLHNNGWTRIYEGMWKFAYHNGEVVIKFDRDDDRSWRSCTANEYYQWLRAKPRKRKYMLRPIAYHNGLLIQPKLAYVCGTEKCDCDDAAKVAHRLRILDWQNHGRTASGQLKFFDTDSIGSGWWNWKGKQAK